MKLSHHFCAAIDGVSAGRKVLRDRRRAFDRHVDAAGRSVDKGDAGVGGHLSYVSCANDVSLMRKWWARVPIRETGNCGQVENAIRFVLLNECAEGMGIADVLTAHGIEADNGGL